MDSLKPHMTSEQLIALVREQLGTTPATIDTLDGGQVAQTFVFTVGDQEFVLRVNRHMAANFAKEAYISRTIDSPHIPIPPIVAVGQFGDMQYAISRRMPGTRLDQMPAAAHTAIMPALVETLDAIHGVDVSAAVGYGTFGDDGQGLFPSWHAYLEAIMDEEADGEYYGHWHALFTTTFLERDVFDHIYEAMTRLLVLCPDVRALVHGDYGFGNVLVQDGRITAVLDWINAKYGDFLYDVAWLDFWSPRADISELFTQHYIRKGVDVPHYTERLQCYCCYIGLDAMRFYAKAGLADAYQWARDRALSVLADPPRS